MGYGFPMTRSAPPAALRRASRAQTRERILDAAVLAFAEQGYEGTSLARIAEAVGLSQPGLLHHFPSKRSLLLAVLERRDMIDSKRITADGERTGLAALDAFVELVEHNATVPGLVQSFSVLAGESAAEQHAGRQYFTQRYAGIRAQLCAHLRAGIERGEIRPDIDCTALATEVFALMDGLQLQWLHDPEGADMVAVFRAYINRLRDHLAR
jgi:AcrR family transcriptional regulator